MSDLTTFDDERSLTRWLSNEGDGGIWESFDTTNSQIVARHLVESRWMHDFARRQRDLGAIEVLRHAEATLVAALPERRTDAAHGSLDTIREIAKIRAEIERRCGIDASDAPVSHVSGN